MIYKQLISILVCTLSFTAISMPFIWQSDASSQQKFPWLVSEFKQAFPEIQIEAALSGHTEGATLISCVPFNSNITSLGEQGILKDLSTEPWLNAFPAYTLAPFQSKSQGNVFCIPLALTTYGFLYHKEMFQRLRLQEPESLQKLIDTLITLQRAGLSSPLTQTHTQHVIGPSVWQGEYGHALWQENSQEFVDTFKQNLALVEKQLAVFQGENSTPIQSFLNKKSAILMTSLDRIDVMKSNTIGAFMPPRAVQDNRCYMTQFAEHGIALVADSPAYQQGMTFLKWLASASYAQVLITHNQGHIPATHYALTSDSDFTHNLQNWINRCEPSLPIENPLKRAHNLSVQNTIPSQHKSLPNKTLQLPSAELIMPDSNPSNIQDTHTSSQSKTPSSIQDTHTSSQPKIPSNIQDTHASGQPKTPSTIQDTHESSQPKTPSAIQDTHESSQPKTPSNIQDTHTSGQPKTPSAIQDTHESSQPKTPSTIQDTHESSQPKTPSNIQDTHESSQPKTPSAIQDTHESQQYPMPKEIQSPELQPIPEEAPETDIPEHPEATLARE